MPDAPRPGDASLKPAARSGDRAPRGRSEKCGQRRGLFDIGERFCCRADAPEQRINSFEAALRDIGDAIVEKSRAPDGSWAGAGAGFVAPSFELCACGTNARFRCVGESEKDVDD